METVRLPHLPNHPLRIGLFKDVKNASFLRKQLLEGNTEFEYAFLDAASILSKNHVLAACFRAINDQLNDRLKSRNVHSEIVFSLSPNNNIAESFRRFGLSDTSTHILAVKVLSSSRGDTEDAMDAHLRANVEGDLVPFTDDVLVAMSDPGRLKKVYKVDVGKVGGREAEAAVSGSMALKGS